MPTKLKNSDQFAFKDIKVEVDGVKVATLQSITYGTTVDKAYTYGQGNTPRSIQQANVSHQGEFAVLQTDFQKLVDKKILDGYFNIIITYTLKAGGVDRLHTDTIEDAQVLDYNKGMNQGDYNSTHTFSFIALGIQYQGDNTYATSIP